MPRLVEDKSEFAKRHGGNPIWLKEEQRYLFHDGASISHDHLEHEVFWEPHTDKQKRIEQKLIYHRFRLEKARADFEHLKAALAGASHDGHVAASFTWDSEKDKVYGPNPGDSVEALKRIKEVHDTINGTVIALVRAYEALPEIQEQRRREQEELRWQQERAMKRAVQQSEIEKITL